MDQEKVAEVLNDCAMPIVSIKTRPRRGRMIENSPSGFTPSAKQLVLILVFE